MKRIADSAKLQLGGRKRARFAFGESRRWQGVLLMSDDDVTQWIRALADGDESAFQKIWERYYSQLLTLARRRLGDRRRVADEDDAVASAFGSFYRGLADGRFPQLDDRNDLWKVLITITLRKALGYIRGEGALKRGGGNVRGESVFIGRDREDGVGGIGEVLGAEPTPELAAQVTDQCEHLLAQLEDDFHRQIALLKLEGYTDHEISERLDCGLRTVQRKLAKIRDTWASETDR